MVWNKIDFTRVKKKSRFGEKIWGKTFELDQDFAKHETGFLYPILAQLKIKCCCNELINDHPGSLSPRDSGFNSICAFLWVSPTEHNGTYFWTNMHKTVLSVLIWSLEHAQPSTGLRVKFRTCKGSGHPKWNSSFQNAVSQIRQWFPNWDCGFQGSSRNQSGEQWNHHFMK